MMKHVLRLFHVALCLVFTKYNLRKMLIYQSLAKYNPRKIFKNQLSVMLDSHQKSKICRREIKSARKLVNLW